MELWFVILDCKHCAQNHIIDPTTTKMFEKNGSLVVPFTCPTTGINDWVFTPLCVDFPQPKITGVPNQEESTP